MTTPPPDPAPLGPAPLDAQPAKAKTTSPRDDRLAAKLRENLHRRKAQTRVMPDTPEARTASESVAPLSKPPTHG